MTGPRTPKSGARTRFGLPESRPDLVSRSPGPVPILESPKSGVPGRAPRRPGRGWAVWPMAFVDPLLAPMASSPHIIGPKEGRTSLAPARDDGEPDPGARPSRAGIADSRRDG